MNVVSNARADEHGASPLGAAQAAAFLEQNPQVQYVDCVFADLCGIVRGKRIARAELESVFETGLGIPFTIYFLDARGEVVEQARRAASPNGSEGTAWPVAGTLTRVNWSQRPHGQVLMTLGGAEGEPYFGEPRNVLKRIAARFANAGLVPSAAFDFDFYLFDRERAKNGVPESPTGNAAREASAQVYGISDIDRFDGVLTGIAEAAAIQGLPPVAATADALAGRFRIGVERVDEVVRAADHAVFLRQVVRAVARKHGLDATFMAKPFLGLAGSAMALRTALRTPAGDAVGERAMRNAIGGLQASMAEAIAIFCPNANGFRRFGDGTIARNKRWGVDNPAAMLNVTRTDVRIEHRLASADANPYLVLAAALAGMHRGIEEGMDPGQPIEGNAARLVDQTMPFAIDAALVALENGSILREYLGPAYVDLYCVTKRAELERFRNHIPAHEYDWYM